MKERLSAFGLFSRMTLEIATFAYQSDSECGSRTLPPHVALAAAAD